MSNQRTFELPPEIPKKYYIKKYPEIFDADEPPGSDWVRRLPEWERKAFAEYGRQHIDLEAAGRKRALFALRDHRGRFVRKRRR